jgi:hypothetical protein
VFHYRDPGRFPEERSQDEPINLEQGEAVLIPEVGDHVTFQYEGQPTAFKVLSRHFAFSSNRCTMNIEVACPSSVQKALCLKE